MTKRTLVILVVAALAAGGAAAAIASSIGGSSDEPVHTLSGGREHTGEMPPADTSTDDMGSGGSMEGMDMGK